MMTAPLCGVACELHGLTIGGIDKLSGLDCLPGKNLDKYRYGQTEPKASAD